MASLGFTGEKQPLLQRHDQNENISNNERLTDGWPPIFWFMMKITGMFYHKTVVSNRRCVTCDMDHFERVVTKNTRRKSKFVRRLDSDNLYNLTISYENDHGEVKVGDQRSYLGILYSEMGTNSRQSQSEKKNCKACQACWWDKHGKVQYYTEKSIGVTHWNHMGSWFVSTVILFAIISLLCTELVYVIGDMFGKRKKLLHLLSYSSFLCALAIYPVMNLCSKVRSSLSGRGPGLWATSLNVRFIIRRLQFLDLQKNGAPGKLFLIMCMVWPIVCAMYRCYVVLGLRGQTGTRRSFACFSAGSSMFMWGCFVYLLYTIRLSFQIQLDLILKFLKRFEGQTDLCQNVLRQVTIDFKCFHQCVRIYMTAMIPMCVLAVTTSLTWQYMLNSDKAKEEDVALQKYINTMIWLEIVMFIILAPIAVGGVDVSYVWERFRTNVYCMMGGEHQFFWEEITRYLRNVEGKTPVISFTMILSIVGFYMAVQFGQQDVIY